MNHFSMFLTQEMVEINTTKNEKKKEIKFETISIEFIEISLYNIYIFKIGRRRRSDTNKKNNYGKKKYLQLIISYIMSYSIHFILFIVIFIIYMIVIIAISVAVITISIVIL